MAIDLDEMLRTRFEELMDESRRPLEVHDNPGKVPVCGGSDDVWPLDGYIQVAIWGAEQFRP